MIKENYVSFEVAKLLKEKGFDEGCRAHYGSAGSFSYEKYEVEASGCEMHNAILAPTLQMVIKWLEEVHHILVVTDYVYECTSTSWVYKIYRLRENGKPEQCEVKGTSYDENNNPTEHIVGYRDYELSYESYERREEAVDEGIRYVLKKYV